MGLGLLITWLGIPILIVTLLMARGGAKLERARARRLLGVQIDEPRQLGTLPGNWWTKLRVLTADRGTWNSVVYLLLLLPAGVLTFTVVVTVWSTAVGLISLPIWNWSLPGGGAVLFGGGDGWRIHTAPELAGAVAAGVVLLLLAPWVTRVLAAMDAAMVRSLLTPDRRRELLSRVKAVEASRARSVDAATAERRRIERDLHDGAQQRLVALAMDLGLARQKLVTGGDHDAAAALVAEAHDEAKRALVELRDLARGIHPPVLTDRGLDAALSALASRSPVHVDIRVDLPFRPVPAVESIAYFVTAEALTNVARHSHAGQAEVLVEHVNHQIVLTVRDDGVGGADPERGTGLTGLRERLEAIDGSLEISSPRGGPTTIEARLPCAS